MPTRDEIIDKVRKLRAHAKSAEKIGSEAEAQAFAATMQRLMSEHKIGLSEIEMERLDETDPIEQIRTDGRVPRGHGKYERPAARCEWMERLASVVAKASYCKIIVNPGTAIITFLGRKSDGIAALETFTYLAACAAEIAHHAYTLAYSRRHIDGWSRGFHRSFLLGFSVRLGERYQEEMDKMKAEWASSCTALVRLTDALKVVENYIAEHKKGPNKMFASAGGVGTGVQNKKAFEEGKLAANGIKLRDEGKKVSGAS